MQPAIFGKSNMEMNFLKMKKKGEVNFVLIREEKDVKISGVVLDHAGTPMNKVKVNCDVIRRKLERWRGYETEYTDEEGRFTFERLKADQIYKIHAQTEEAPFLDKEIRNIPAGTDDLVIQMDFESVEVTIDLDLTGIPDYSGEESKFYVSLYKKGDYTKSIVFRQFYSKEEVPLDRPLMVYQPGRYTLKVRGHDPQNRIISGNVNFEVDQNTSKRLHFTVPLTEWEMNQLFFAVGKCVFPDGSPVMVRYRVLCRLLKPTSEQYLTHASLVDNPEAPQEFIGCFGIMLPMDGIYQLVYVRYDGKVFHRTIVHLSRDQASPWTGHPGPPGITLPDVLLADFENQ